MIDWLNDWLISWLIDLTLPSYPEDFLYLRKRFLIQETKAHPSPHFFILFHLTIDKIGKRYRDVMAGLLFQLLFIIWLSKIISYLQPSRVFRVALRERCRRCLKWRAWSIHWPSPCLLNDQPIIFGDLFYYMMMGCHGMCKKCSKNYICYI